MPRLPLAMLGLGAVIAGPALAQVAACPADFQGLRTMMTCQCSAEAGQDGTVWGTGVYSDDSRICRAARHLGVIPAEGGVVTILPAPGLPQYVGTTANGVATQHYGEWGTSFTFRP